MYSQRVLSIKYLDLIISLFLMCKSSKNAKNENRGNGLNQRNQMPTFLSYDNHAYEQHQNVQNTYYSRASDNGYPGHLVADNQMFLYNQSRNLYHGSHNSGIWLAPCLRKNPYGLGCEEYLYPIPIYLVLKPVYLFSFHRSTSNFNSNIASVQVADYFANNQAYKTDTNLPIQTKFSQKMTNILNDILKYQVGNTLPDISILMKYDYFFNDILCQEQLEIYFLIYSRLIEIERRILEKNPYKKYEFEQTFFEYINQINFLNLNSNIIFNVPMLISLKNFLEIKIKLKKSNTKNHIAICFGLKLVTSVIIKTLQEINNILSQGTSIYSHDPEIKIDYISNLNSNIILKIISKIFFSTFSFSRNFRCIFVLSMELQKKRCPDIFKDKKIMFKEHDISFLPDILLYLEESDIIEIIAFNERKIGTLRVKHSHRSPVSVNFINQNEIVLSKEILIKIIACYFSIFEDDKINFLEAFNYIDIVKHRYRILEKRFEAIKRDFILFDTCDRTLLRRLLYDTFYFFHYCNVYRHNT